MVIVANGQEAFDHCQLQRKKFKHQCVLDRWGIENLPLPPPHSCLTKSPPPGTLAPLADCVSPPHRLCVPSPGKGQQKDARAMRHASPAYQYALVQKLMWAAEVGVPCLHDPGGRPHSNHSTEAAPACEQRGVWW